ncbi:MAG: hypothetical protein FWD97_05155 [Defluviitaleaceae bacterium]|nr:hypothetical protein [Defluviitaleaceae bacterium]
MALEISASSRGVGNACPHQNQTPPSTIGWRGLYGRGGHCPSQFDRQCRTTIEISASRNGTGNARPYRMLLF